MLLNNSISMLPMSIVLLISGEVHKWHHFYNISQTGWVSTPSDAPFAPANYHVCA